MPKKYDYDERQLAAQRLVWRNMFGVLVTLLLVDAAIVSNIYPWTVYPEDKIFIFVMIAAIIGVFMEIGTGSFFPKGKILWPVIAAFAVICLLCGVFTIISFTRNEPFFTAGKLDTGALFVILTAFALVGFIASLVSGIKEARAQAADSDPALG
ncbi:MAG: hypothetical protein LBR58_05520 [Propionibacteriaceae bacterium]|jgi:hypothetical protein|nr:hypothetical protein [Propionibacteriaceae bacterium]